MNRFETPVIQGFEGSDTIRSKASLVRSRWLRPSRNTMPKRGSRSSGPWNSGKKRAASQVAGSISTHSSRSIG